MNQGLLADLAALNSATITSVANAELKSKLAQISDLLNIASSLSSTRLAQIKPLVDALSAINAPTSSP